MKKKICFGSLLKIVFIVIILIATTFSYSLSQIIMSDNFDQHSDWSPTQRTGGQGKLTKSSSSSDLPSGGGYNYFTIDGSSYNNKGENTLSINSTVKHGSSGKSLLFHSEIQTSDGWGNDGLLGIQLPGGETGYNEIYIRFFIRFQSNWKWQKNADVGHKILHVAHHKAGDSKTAFFSVTENKPRAFFKIYKYQNGSLGSDVTGTPTVSRYNGSTNPNYSEGAQYFPGGGYGGNGTDMTDNVNSYRSAIISEYGATTNVIDTLFTALGDTQYQAQNIPFGMFGDGDWHCWEWRLKMNSAAGASDGIYSFWQDGIQIYTYTDIDWIQSGAGSPSSRQWNYVWLGGNNNNVHSSPSTEPEQWYAIDDLVISTTPIGNGNITTSIAAPQNVIITDNVN